MDVRVVVAARVRLPDALDPEAVVVQRVQTTPLCDPYGAFCRHARDLETGSHETVADPPSIDSPVEDHPEIGGVPVPVIRHVAVHGEAGVGRPRAGDDRLAVETGHRRDVVERDLTERRVRSVRTGYKHNLARDACTTE